MLGTKALFICYNKQVEICMAQQCVCVPSPHHTPEPCTLWPAMARGRGRKEEEGQKHPLRNLLLPRMTFKMALPLYMVLQDLPGPLLLTGLL